MNATEAKTLATFGRTIRRLRKQRGMNQDDLAEAAKLSRNYISDIERGVRNPSLLAVIGIARALKLQVRELLVDIDPRMR